jgi:hypothetical protein
MLQRYRKQKFFRIVVGALGVAALLFIAGDLDRAQPAMAQTICDVNDDFDEQEQEFLSLINNYRAENGLSALTASVNLNRSSAWMAQDLADNNYFSHTDSLRRTPAQRVDDCDGAPYVGENIAAGTNRDTAQEAFDAWRASAGHNANMLNGSYMQIGIARHYDAGAFYSWYWVTDFSTSDDGTNALGAGGTAGTLPGARRAFPAPRSTAFTSAPARALTTWAVHPWFRLAPVGVSSGRSWESRVSLSMAGSPTARPN